MPDAVKRTAKEWRKYAETHGCGECGQIENEPILSDYAKVEEELRLANESIEVMAKAAINLGARAEKLEQALHQARAEWHEEKKRAREAEILLTTHEPHGHNVTNDQFVALRTRHAEAVRLLREANMYVGHYDTQTSNDLNDAIDAYLSREGEKP